MAARFSTDRERLTSKNKTSSPRSLQRKVSAQSTPVFIGLTRRIITGETPFFRLDIVKAP